MDWLLDFWFLETLVLEKINYKHKKCKQTAHINVNKLPGVTDGNSGLLTSFIGDGGAELVRSEPAEPDRFLVKIE